MIRKALLLLVFLCASLSGCQKVYFSALEAVGMPKRDLFVRRVRTAQDTQQEAKEEFRDALERFRAVVLVDGGSLEQRYDELQKQLNRSEAQAREVSERIDAVEDVAEALFDEWEDELDQYKNRELRRKSSQTLKETRQRYKVLIESMRRAEASIEPVLEPLRDHVLFLKHNLNARAIASLGAELGQVENKVEVMINEMETAIAEADRFIASMEQAR